MGIPVSAILLAAGSSKRIGQLKQLLPLNNKPVIIHCLDSIVVSGVKHIVTVLGPQGAEISKIVEDFKRRSGDFKITIVLNNNPESEMAESVMLGINAINDSSKGILIFPSDHPLVSAETIKNIIDAYNKNPEKIIIPSYNGKRGHPALFPRAVIEEIFSGLNLREIIKKYPGKVMTIEVPDEGAVLDIDTLGDFEKLQELYKRRLRCSSSS